MSASGSLTCLEWAVAERPLKGEPVSGDSFLVREFGDDVLIAVMDGLGHGAGAAEASRRAVDYLANASPGSALPVLLKSCHEALRGSRGIALTMIVYRPGIGSLQWTSVGNVEGVLWHRPGQPGGERLCVTPRGGVVGYQLPTGHVATLEVAEGDVCCLATDGIASSFIEKLPLYFDPRALAEHILVQYGRESDDALVLAVRFAGSTA